MKTNTEERHRGTEVFSCSDRSLPENGELVSVGPTPSVPFFTADEKTKACLDSRRENGRELPPKLSIPGKNTDSCGGKDFPAAADQDVCRDFFSRDLRFQTSTVCSSSALPGKKEQATGVFSPEKWIQEQIEFLGWKFLPSATSLLRENAKLFYQDQIDLRVEARLADGFHPWDSNFVGDRKLILVESLIVFLEEHEEQVAARWMRDKYKLLLAGVRFG